MKAKKITFISLLLAAFLTTSCLPEQNAIRDLSSENQQKTDTEDPNEEGPSSSLAETNFFQNGGTKTTSSLVLASDFSDSFLLRGENIHSYIRDNIAGTQNKLCIAAVFPQSTGSGSNKVLVLAARARSYFNSSYGDREYYAQMEVANENANVNDCLNINLNTSIASETGFSSIAFSMDAVCPSCQTNVSSSRLLIFGASGTPIEQISLGNLGLIIRPSQTTSPSSGVTCQSDDVCRVEGFDCCLQSQCANHGETRPSADTSSQEYLSALEQILARPELLSSFTEYFYVCPEQTSGGSSGGSGGGEEPKDPQGQAQNLFNELQDLYYCLNPVLDDEFSVCSSLQAVDQSAIGSGGTTVSAGADDINFSSLNPALRSNNIVSIQYAGASLYNTGGFNGAEKAMDPSVTISAPNDNMSDAQSITIDKPIPAGATEPFIKIGYKVDGTCERIGPSLAKCVKTYIQGQQSSPAKATDHPSGSLSFRLPPYANFNYNVLVEVGGVKIAQGSDTWSPDPSNSEVDFVQSIYNNQKVEITYYVSQGVEALLSSKEAALEKVNTHCKCDPNTSCNLKPVYEDDSDPSTLYNYVCVYGQPNTPEPPLQKTVFLSSKTVPHKYYDHDGVHYEAHKISEGQPQEGAAFSYGSGNLFKPNNQSQYIGFNEIYGSFDRKEISAMPATVVDIAKGKQYDIFVDSGSFSSCLNCGTDYFSNLQKLFPGNFQHKGAGYLPDMVESRLMKNRGQFSAFDMKFGRACFVPATMIPWTHKASSDVSKQRRDRLQAQHFMFANGYNKDWYGFDYGALIGSYDGVRWFAIGNQRRIQAKSNKLYLAINAYFGDLTIDNSFKITVSELSSIINAGSAITHDTDSDGAQCQKAHFCETDNDCIAQLGYDYTCKNVAGLYTSWPVFDGNGNEISGSTTLSLLGMVGGANGHPKRCVYRGSGSLCSVDPRNVSSSDSYANTTDPAFHTCSPNTHCAPLTSPRFNDRIARYGESPANQNNQSVVTSVVGEGDTFGLGARLIGRPFDFYGNKLPPGNAAAQLEANNATAMCVPGKDVSSSLSIADLNSHSSGARKADKALGIGKTMPLGFLQSDKYYAACPAVDEEENYIFNSLGKLSSSLNDHSAGSQSVMAATQNMSTNALSISAFDSLDFFNDDDGALTTKKGYTGGSCLRAPGASCFTDFDCSPNSFISSKVKSLTNLSDYLSSAEESFWEEELVCGNSQDRYPTGSIYPNPVYELNEHKCCRETGKDFTFASQRHMESDFEVVAGNDPSGEILLPGVNQNINSPKRYSRTHTVYDKLISERASYPPLYAPGSERTNVLDYEIQEQLRQYNTLHLNNSRMCCTGHWVRNFATENGGGHRFSGSRHQNIPKTTFKTLNWFAQTENAPSYSSEMPFHCNPQDYMTQYCEMITYTEGGAEETKWLKWFEKFELVGIPQILIETNGIRHGEEYATTVHDFDQTAISPRPLPNTIEDVNVNGIPDATIDSDKDYYSAASYDNLKIGGSSLKKVFSEDSFSCCVPTGVEVDGSMPNSNCCSGQINTENNVSRCCLNDFTDLSVYTNRYVSSEGAYVNGQPISDSDIDEDTGYIRKEVVMEMAGTMCCSGKAAYGVALGDYFVPMDDGGVLQNAKTRRWLYLEELDNANEVGGAASKYDIGMKWNNHVYCVPAEMADDTSSGSGSTATQN